MNQTEVSVLVFTGSDDPQSEAIRLLLQLPSEEPARLQTGGTALSQDGVRDGAHVQWRDLQ